MPVGAVGPPPGAFGGAQPPGGPPPADHGGAPPPGEPPRRAPWIPIALVVVLLVAAVGIALALTGGDDDDEVSSDDTITTTTTSPTPPGETTTTRPSTATTFPDDPDRYGDDTFLDLLWDECDDGDWEACDDLYFESPGGSRYEAFGDSCGGRNEPSGLCADLYGDGGDGGDGEPMTYGDDPGFDALWDRCDDGDWAACDELYLDSPIGSDYEAFGDSCGGRNDPAGYCEGIYG